MGHQQTFGFGFTGAGAIGVARPPERLLGLLRQHDRLLADVARKRKVLARAEEEVGQVAAEVGRRLRPILEESSRIDAELHGLFEELLGKSKLGKRARRAVREVYDQLQDDGVLSAEERHQSRTAAGESSPHLDDDEEEDRTDDDDVPAAAPVNAGATLRGLFLRLARALHPDRVQDGGEKAARTETMKEINRAYREGDVARLAELERKLKEAGLFAGEGAGVGETDGARSDGRDSVDQKCEALEQTNQAMRQQLKTLRRDLRDLRDSDMGRMAAEIERRRRRGGGTADPFIDLDADAQSDLERFRTLRDYVRAFRDGDISLDAFLAGPPVASDDDDLDDDDIDAVFDELSQLLSPRTARRRKPKRRGRFA